MEKTKSFDLPLRRDRQGNYKLRCNSPVFTCGTSDFFLPEADPWRLEAWSMIKARPDLTFAIITKRPQRFYVNLPLDWGQGYPNVRLYCTCLLYTSIMCRAVPESTCFPVPLRRSPATRISLP